MQAKTELLLYHLLWAADMMMRPTFRNLMGGFEAWAYHNGLNRAIQRLEAKGFLESSSTPLDQKRLVRLTRSGRLQALGGRDPQSEWDEPWDRKWRMVLFDLPAKQKSLRKRLHRALASLGFGCLQDSVWISTRPPRDPEKAFVEQGKDCRHLFVLETVSQGLKVDQQIVRGAWNFDRINSDYKEHMDILGEFSSKTAHHPPTLLEWSARENAALVKGGWIRPAPAERVASKRLSGSESLATALPNIQEGRSRGSRHKLNPRLAVSVPQPNEDSPLNGRVRWS